MDLRGLFLRAPRPADPDTRVFFLGYALLLPFFLAPLGATRLLPGLDLPFHLSIVDMLDKAGSPGSPYEPYYEITSGVAPYAAYYLVLGALGKVAGLLLAHKLIVAVYVAALPLAAAALLAACRRSRIPALLAFPLAYNLTLHYGFISFALALPLILLLLAQAARYLTDAAPSHARWLGMAATAVALFFCHLQNFLYGVAAAAAFVVFCAADLRRRLLALLALMPSGLALLAWQAVSTFEGDPARQKKTLAFAWSELSGARLADMNGGRTPLVDDLIYRVWLVPHHLLRGFRDGADGPAARILLATLAIYFVMGWFGRPATALEDRSRLRLAGVVAFLGALGAYLALPHHLHSFELATFFPRFSVLVVLAGLLLVPGGLRRLSAPLSIAAALPAVLQGLVYARALEREYRRYAAETADFLHVVERVPAGARVLGLVFDPQSATMNIESASIGLPHYYVALRPAPGSAILPLRYCGMRHMPCRPRPERPAPAPDPWEPYRADFTRALPAFDYVLLGSPPPLPDHFGDWKDGVEPIARRGRWHAYRTRPGFVPPRPKLALPVYGPPPPSTWPPLTHPEAEPDPPAPPARTRSPAGSAPATGPASTHATPGSAPARRSAARTTGRSGSTGAPAKKSSRSP